MILLCIMLYLYIRHEYCFIILLFLLYISHIYFLYSNLLEFQFDLEKLFKVLQNLMLILCKHFSEIIIHTYFHKN